MKIVLATRNSDKIKEIEAMMARFRVSLLRADAFAGVPDVVEDGKTLEENAIKKARVIRDFAGVSALADDTGLEVDALDGAPGVFSSRFAGEGATYDDNCRKLLEAMSEVPDERRGARFRCVMALALVNTDAEKLYNRLARGGAGTAAGAAGPSEMLVTEGIVDGRVTRAKRGSSGFGYDPVFEIPALAKTLAEIGLEAKNKLSHRYRALVEMRALLVRYGLIVEKEA